MLEKLASWKGLRIYLKLIQKKLQHFARGVTTASWRQPWEALITIHKTSQQVPDYPDRTYKSKLLKVGREDSNTAKKMLYNKGVLNPDMEQLLPWLQTQSRWKLLIARNLYKFGRKVIEGASTDAVPSTFLTTLDKNPKGVS